MGQIESKRFFKLKSGLSDSQGLTQKSSTYPKKFLVRLSSKEIWVEVSDYNLTCGWLLSEVIRASKPSDEVVALQTADRIESLDMWLTQFERTLVPFKDRDEFEVVTKRHAPALICKEQFDLLKVIGKGGFSKVLLGI